MFDISFLEITVIFVITLLVVGPEKLPGLVRDVGRVVKKLRRIVTQTRYELEREIDFEEERKKLTKGFEEERKKLTKGKEGLDEAMDELDDLMNIAPDRDEKEPGDDQNTPKPDLDKPGDDQNTPNPDLDNPGNDQNVPKPDLKGPENDQDEPNLAQKENDGEAEDKNQTAGP